jgi:hypothetical protein
MYRACLRSRSGLIILASFFITTKPNRLHVAQLLGGDFRDDLIRVDTRSANRKPNLISPV